MSRKSHKHAARYAALSIRKGKRKLYREASSPDLILSSGTLK